MTDKCPICEDEPMTNEREQAMQACGACANKLGLIPMPPARGPFACRNCGGKKFLHAIPREHSAGNLGMDSNTQLSAPMMLTHVPRAQKGYVLRYAQALNIQEGYGLLEIYACFRCGAVEWYCDGVQRIPISPHLMTEVVDYDQTTTPYR